MHRTLLVWLLLLALPFQAVAAAGMLASAPEPMAMAMTPMAVSHAHAGQSAHCAARAASSPDVAHDAHGGKSGSCATCCVGAAITPAALPALGLQPADFISIPFRAGHVPSVDPSLPDRPPRAALA